MDGNAEQYKLIEDGAGKVRYECPLCGENIMNADVSKNPPWITALKGESNPENIPYCPKCDDKPEYKGVSNISTVNSEKSIMMFLG